ncbi:MAG: hypothetical protein IT585_06965 [candidate division Zixibacteria bacterium]|nr:hypothetical protein [candidate division Zixibacteria bacterium]
MQRLLAVLIAATGLLLSACASERKSEIAQSEWEKVIALRGEARDFLRELQKNEFNSRTGAGPDERADIFARYQNLFSEANIELLQRVEDSFEPGPDERKFRRLRLFLIESRIRAALLPERQYLEEMLSGYRFNLNDRTYSLPQASRVLAESPDRTLREQLYENLLPLLQRENAVRRRVLELTDSALYHFGYGSILSFVEEKLDVDYAALATQAQEFLTASDSLFRALAEDLVPQLAGIKLNNLRGYDIAYLMNADPLGALFHPDSLPPIVARTLRAWHLPPDTLILIQIVVDSSDFGGRSSTYAIAPPSDLRIIVTCPRGSAHFHEYYHELGHALGYLYSQERELELAQLGSVAVSEASAFALEDLLLEPRYLTETLTMAPAAARRYVRLAAFQRLLLLRRLCADVLFEQVLFSEAENIQAEYEQSHRQLFGFEWSAVDREMYLRGIGEETAAEYLQGLGLAAALQNFATENLGDDYFRQPDYGNLLKEFWSFGRRLSASQLSVQLDLGSLDPNTTLKHLRRLTQP